MLVLLVRCVPLPRPTTLIVEDNIVNLRVMEMYCKKRGLPYLTAKDGQQAVETFARRQGEGQEFVSAFATTGSSTGREEDPQLLR
jgi:CheY-like chemotaxis protein